MAKFTMGTRPDEVEDSPDLIGSDQIEIFKSSLYSKLNLKVTNNSRRGGTTRSIYP